MESTGNAAVGPQGHGGRGVDVTTRRVDTTEVRVYEQRASERFDRVARDYDATNSRWPPQSLIDRIIALADPQPGDAVVDIGTGTGRLAFALAPRVARVVGIDVSEEMLDRARGKAQELALKNVEFRRGSFAEPGLSEKVRLVVSSLAFEWVPDDEKAAALSRTRSLLAESGRVVLGERMLFVDPRAEPERFSQALIELVAGATCRPPEDIARGLPHALWPDHVRAATRVAADHQQLRLRPDHLAKLFRDCHFVVETVEEVTPLLGILVARRSGAP